MLNFLVIKVTSSCSAILGRSGLHAFKAIASTYHMKLEFLTRNIIGKESTNKNMAQSCYIVTQKYDRI